MLIHSTLNIYVVYRSFLRRFGLNKKPHGQISIPTNEFLGGSKRSKKLAIADVLFALKLYLVCDEVYRPLMYLPSSIILNFKRNTEGINGLTTWFFISSI